MTVRVRAPAYSVHGRLLTQTPMGSGPIASVNRRMIEIGRNIWITPIHAGRSVVAHMYIYASRTRILSIERRDLTHFRPSLPFRHSASPIAVSIASYFPSSTNTKYPKQPLQMARHSRNFWSWVDLQTCLLQLFPMMSSKDGFSWVLFAQ